MLRGRDYRVATVAGLLTAVFVSGILFFSWREALAYSPILFVTAPLIYIAGIRLGFFLGKKYKFFEQFGRFAVVGFFCASIDFFILNALSELSGIERGFLVGWVNVPGFSVALVVSYLLNHRWVFGNNNLLDQNESGLKKVPNLLSAFRHFPTFLVISVIGLFLNSGIIIILTTYIPSQNYDDELVLNVAKVVASAVVMISNFIGYKFIAFRKKMERNPK